MSRLLLLFQKWLTVFQVMKNVMMDNELSFVVVSEIVNCVAGEGISNDV